MGAAKVRLRPAPRWGLGRARRLWRVVVAVWVVSIAAFLPALWVVASTVGPALERLPAAADANGDARLIIAAALPHVRPPFRLAVGSGLVVLCLFTILWQAGVVSRELWSGGRRVRLGEVLGLGMVAFWPFARLALVSLVALAAGLGGVWWSLGTAARRAYQAMLEGRMEALLAAAVGLSLLLLVMVPAVTFRAAWLLGRPGRRSALLAWGRGLLDTVRTPLASLGVVLLWGVPVALCAPLPLLVGAWSPAARTGWLLPVLTVLTVGLRAFCWVGLFTSFAPASGLVGPAAAEPAPAGDRAEAEAAV